MTGGDGAMRRALVAGGAARAYLAGTVGLSVAATVLVLAQATLLATTIARASAGAPLSRLHGVVIALLVVVCARAAVGYATEVTALRTAATVKSALRQRLLRHVLALGPRWVSDRHPGEVSTLATRGLDALDPYLSRYLPQVVLAVLVPVMVLVRVAWSDWVSAVIIAVTLPLVPVFMVLVGARARQRSEQQWRLLARLGGHFLDVVAGLPTLKVFNRAKAQAEVIRSVTDAHRRQSMSTLRLAFVSALVLDLLATISMALVAVAVGLRLLRGGMPYQTALLVLLLTPEAYLPLRQLGTHYHASLEGVAATRQVFEVLDEPVVAPDRPHALARCPDPGVEPIVFEDVSVCLPDRNVQALDSISLTVHAGDHVVVTGPSGAGKSTLLALLLLFARPTTGTVRVGGQDLSDVDPAEWRRAVAWVPQQPSLCAGSILDNIRLGVPEASRADVRRVAALAGAEEFIAALPEGYDTQLVQQARTLSSGQRQRLALARAFLRDASLLVLDEPTAHLDAANARAIETTLRTEFAHRTVVWVTHQAPSVDADVVVRLETGRLVPAGDARVAM